MALRRVEEEESGPPKEEMEEWARDEIDNRGVRNLKRKMEEEGNITSGNREGCPCPWCGKMNGKALQRVRIKRGSQVAIEKPCDHCGRLILYLAQFVEVNEGTTVSLRAKACSVNG